jgi:hypothetical protein
MIKPNKLYCQIILYAKGWFKKTNMLDDLKIILSKHFGCEPEVYNLNDIYQMVIETVESTEQFNFKRFLAEGMWSYTWEDKIDKKWIIERLMGQASIIPVRNDKKEFILNLGEPDYTWLPKKEGDLK